VRDCARRLCVILRLAVLMHRGRTGSVPSPRSDAEDDTLVLRFPGGWLSAHPLTQLELEEEAQRLVPAGHSLDFS
jgi:exopolyphosphatase/guanosine-5'-triphosphate,3'-diphosphate pyrophosphatase